MCKLFFHRVWVFFFFLYASAALPGELYKSVSPDGKVTYSSKPAKTGSSEKLEVDEIPGSHLSEETLQNLAKLRKDSNNSALNGNSVTLFTTSWCGYCKKARAYLAAKNIPYQDIDIETESGLTAYSQAGGQSGVPYMVAKGKSLFGFDAGSYDSFFSDW
jgi:glutaredoxin